jgi:hypothetical protein
MQADDDELDRKHSKSYAGDVSFFLKESRVINGDDPHPEHHRIWLGRLNLRPCSALSNQLEWFRVCRAAEVAVRSLIRMLDRSASTMEQAIRFRNGLLTAARLQTPGPIPAEPG